MIDKKAMSIAMFNAREKRKKAHALALSIESLSVVTGTTAGGTAVTIQGVGFNGQTVITFGTTPAVSVVTIDSRRITCKTPAHAAGAVSVTVTQGIQTYTKANAFTYS
jgi:hypothetical protein